MSSGLALAETIEILNRLEVLTEAVLIGCTPHTGGLGSR
jgi:hypothetical protein